MFESGYLPLGAEHDKSAPYNKEDNKPLSFRCVVVETMMRRVDVHTSDYDEECEKGEDGFPQYSYETDNVDWRSEYEREHYTIQDLLIELANYIREDIARHKGRDVVTKRLYEMLEECESFSVDEIDVWKDD